jgi:amino acid adenylation domain-containing protein
VLELPTDKPRPAVQTHRGARYEFALPAELTERLHEVSRKEGVTLFMTLLAGWQLLLSRYSGQEDIVVGTPIANRHRAEVEPLIGFFVNMLALRARLTPGMTFRELLAQAREVCLGAYAHQDLPFEKLVEELQPERSMSHSPLFQVMFSLQNAPVGALELPGLTLSEMNLEGEEMTEKFDLTLNMHESGDAIGGTFSYSTDLFDHATIERMAEHFTRLLEEAPLAPERPISELELSSGAERRRLLVEWNETRADYARERVLHELFEEQVRRTPAAIAVVFGNESLTYAELDGRANQLAHHLRGLGVSAESLVAVCAERSVEMVVGLLGVLKAGGAYVPLDPAYPVERLSFMLDDARASILVTQARLLEKLSGVAARVVCLDADWETIAGESVTSPRVRVGAENPAYVIYTSGSTGRPKGVVISHSAICNHMTWMQEALPLDASDAVLQKTPFSFDASVWEFYAPLVAGARLVMAAPGGHQDGSYLVRIIEQERITILQTVPSLLRMLLVGSGLRRCQTLRRLFCGGEPLTRELQERLYEQLDAVTLYNLYGPTEATIEASAWECERESERRVVPIGRPISNAQMYVLDKHWQPVPQGTVGELYIGGAGLARGYLHRPDLTAQKFVPHPFSDEPGARLYRTGDLARHLPDGALEFLGRADHQVKVRGFRIELGEIEAALNELEIVEECVVMAREDAPGEQHLVAYLVARAGGMAPASGLRELLRAKLPEHMIPTLFVELDELPLTPNGKLDRRALPVPARVGSEVERNFVAPRTAVEEIVAELWSESLGLERLGVHDNFFEVGGHSLVATLLISRLRDAFQIDIPLSVFFNTTPTVERMSEAIEMLLIERASDGDVEKILAELDGLSDDEVKAVLTGGDGRAESNAEAL